MDGNGQVSIQGPVLVVPLGFGYTALDLGDDYPDIEIRGLDSVLAQPFSMPPNCQFQMDPSFEQDWNFRPEFSHVFVPGASLVITDWPRFIKNIYGTLKPGGFVEFREPDLDVLLDGTTQWAALARDGAKRQGLSLDIIYELPQLLLKAGFSLPSVHRLHRVEEAGHLSDQVRALSAAFLGPYSDCGDDFSQLIAHAYADAGVASTSPEPVLLWVLQAWKPSG